MASSITVKNLPYLWKANSSSVGSRPAASMFGTVIDEHYFSRMLRVERKRTERSGKPFLLMIINSNGLFQDSDIALQTVEAVGASIRETDTLGWYKTGSALAIVFTEIGSADAEVVKVIVDKVTTALRERLDFSIAREFNITCHLYPEKNDHHKKGSADIRLYPDLPRIAAAKKSARIVKRSLDIVGSLFAILLLAPVFLLVAVIIRLTSSGPVLFRQTRIGQHGKPFTFLKFRSMHANNDARIHQEYVKKLIAGHGDLKQADGGEVAFKLINDPRITPIGRFIRRTSLDELPQFFNVLCGQMSLVGPRPPVQYEYEAYDAWHRQRLMEVKPGITGLWQVTGRSRTTFDEMVRLDLKYASSWSILMDLEILWRTPSAVLSGRGAY